MEIGETVHVLNKYIGNNHLLAVTFLHLISHLSKNIITFSERASKNDVQSLFDPWLQFLGKLTEHVCFRKRKAMSHHPIRGGGKHHQPFSLRPTTTTIIIDSLSIGDRRKC